MADAIGSVVVELVADPTGIRRGIEQASSALTRIGAIGVLAGNLLTRAFDTVTNYFRNTVNELRYGSSELVQRLGESGQQAAALLTRSFAEIEEASSQFHASVLERVLPGIAALVESFASVSEQSAAARVAIELLAGALKLLVTSGAIVLGVFRTLESVLKTVVETIVALVNLDPGSAWESIRKGAIDFSKITAETGKLIQDIWNETAISAERVGVAGKEGSEKAARGFNKLATEAKRVFEATRTPAELLEYRIGRLNTLLEAGLISWDTYGRAVQMARDKITGIGEVMRSIGEGLSNAFTDAILGTKKLSEGLRDVLRNAAQLLLNKVFTQLFLGAGGGTTGPLGGLFGSLFANAQGGLYKVAGSGGIDSQVVAMRATPGEMVQVTRPGDGSGGGIGLLQPRVTINNYTDAQVTTRRGAEEDLEITVRGLVRDEMGRPGGQQTMLGAYGVRPRVRSR